MASNLLMASNLRAMAFNLLAMASNLRAMASNLKETASNLLAMASNLRAMASNPVAIQLSGEDNVNFRDPIYQFSGRNETHTQKQACLELPQVHKLLFV